MPPFVINLIAAALPKLLDWLAINGGKLVVFALGKFRQLKESHEDTAALKDKAKDYQAAIKNYKAAIEVEAPKELQDQKKKEMNDAFREFVKFRPSKF